MKRHINKFNHFKINEETEEEDYVMPNSPTINGDLNELLEDILHEVDNDGDHIFMYYFENYGNFQRFVEKFRRYVVENGWKISKI